MGFYLNSGLFVSCRFYLLTFCVGIQCCSLNEHPNTPRRFCKQTVPLIEYTIHRRKQFEWDDYPTVS